ncbi:MAG: aldose epimerase family protein [Acidobacteriota bacterium]|nr:aldose epimerase family protein [Acidobacteriota bacterium]
MTRSSTTVAIVALAAVACGPSDVTVEQVAPPGPQLEKEPFGEVDGMPATLYTLRNRNGLVAKVTDFGAILVEMSVPDRDGSMADVTLGFDTLADYAERNDPGFGSTIGRYANRIAMGRFELDGTEYELAINNGRHHLHGGLVGFNKVMWRAQPAETHAGPAVRFDRRSADGEEGYPGNLDVSVTYVLTHGDELRIEMEATTDAPTVVNLANHSYWNLAGHDAGPVYDHRIEILASRYTPTDDELMTTGAIDAVEGTALDLRAARRLGDAMDALEVERPREPNGFDDNFVLDGESGALRLIARVEDPTSGRVMELETDQPGVQLYTSNFLAGLDGKDGAQYGQHGALCLETQLFPDSANKHELEGWPSPVLRPGEGYRHVMVHRFSVAAD